MDQPGETLPLIGQIAKLQLQRGDALVLCTEKKLSVKQHEALAVALTHFLGKLGFTLSMVPVLVLEEGMTLQVMSQEIKTKAVDLS